MNKARESKQTKNSIDYAELAGLKITLSQAKNAKPEVFEWIQNRIKELEEK